MSTLEKIMKEISEHFLSDGNQYLNRYEYLLESTFTHVGTRSKLLVDLLFSMECSLKSLLFIESQVDEKETYRKIKSHNLIKLIEKVNQSPEIIELKTFITSKNIESISVACRYTLEANIQFREPIGSLGDTYYNTVADPNWIDDVYKQAKKLSEYVSDISDLKYGIFSIEDAGNLDINELIEISNRVRDISK